MDTVIILGGGLAGLAAAAALGNEGFAVELLESRPFLGGRATSYPLPGESGEPGEIIDNCQHILIRCCVNLLDFYQRMGVAGKIRFHKKFNFIEPGGRLSVLRAGPLPAPLHFSDSFLTLRFLGTRDKLAVSRGLAALAREYHRRHDLDSLTMGDWLREKRQPPRAIERFWRPVLVSAANEEPDALSARYGCQVFYLGFLAGRNYYEMGIPDVPLGELYSSSAWDELPNVRIRLRTPVEAVELEGDRATAVVAAGSRLPSDWVVSCLPVDRAAALLPVLQLNPDAWGSSPITGIHLWFDRPVTSLPHAALLDRTIQWFFNKEGGRYLQLVVSASRSLLPLGKAEVVALALRELAEFLPAVDEATLEKAHVVKEVRATFCAAPGLDALRPPPETAVRNLLLAGDWTQTGWPATMEGAVRSGYAAADALLGRLGRPKRFLRPDVG